MPRRKAKPPSVAEDRAWWFGEIAAQSRARIEKGRAEYGDESFERAPRELEIEILEEAVDIVGWIYVLWRSLHIDPDADVSEGKFLRAVRENIAAQTFGSPPARRFETRDEVLRDIERMAAVAAVQWRGLRQRLGPIMTGAMLTEPRPEPIVEPPARVGRRGGLSG